HLKRHLLPRVAELAAREIVPPIPGDPTDRLDVTERDRTDATELVPEASEYIQLNDLGGGVIIVKLQPDPGASDVQGLLTGLAAVVADLGRCPRYSTVVLASEHPQFIPATVQSEVEAAVLECQRVLLAAPI